MGQSNGILEATGRKTFPFVDADGVRHEAPPFTVGDIADLTAFFGPLDSWGERFGDPSAAAVFLWHSLRKEGLSRAQIRAKTWAMTADDVADMFIVGDVGKVGEIVVGILRNSGLVAGASDGRPPVAAAGVTASTGSEPSPVPSPAA